MGAQTRRAMPRQKRGDSKQDYGTPHDFLEAACRRLGIFAFTLDIAASSKNAVCKRYFSKRENAFDQRWQSRGWSWLNPEFDDIEPWAARAFAESQSGARIAMLTPASVGANWWDKWVHRKGCVLFLNGRLTFVGQSDPYPKDCALTLYGPGIAPGYDTWRWRA